MPQTAPVAAQLQALLERGSRWAETGDDPRTGVSCWGLVRYAYGLADISLPASACEADAHFVLADFPYQPWDMPLADFSGLFHGPRHVGILLTTHAGFHCSRATNGIARFSLHDALWKRRLRHVWRLKEFA